MLPQTTEPGEDAKAPAAEKPPAPSDEDNPGVSIDGPSEDDLAEMFGGAPALRDDDYFLEDGEGKPDVDAVRQKVPAKTQVLMEELFRAKLEKVRRVNPKKIR